jgi:hypothetical protein
LQACVSKIFEPQSKLWLVAHSKKEFELILFLFYFFPLISALAFTFASGQIS